MMEKYLINPPSLQNHDNQVLCIDDYGVEGELIPNKWYNIIEKTESAYIVKNDWYEVLPYSKLRFRLEKQNLPHG